MPLPHTTKPVVYTRSLDGTLPTLFLKVADALEAQPGTLTSGDQMFLQLLVASAGVVHLRYEKAVEFLEKYVEFRDEPMPEEGERV